MDDYGGKESSYNFTTFKYYLLAACNAATKTSFPNSDNVFYENFILDIVIHSLRMAMKCINDKLARISGVRLFRPLFSPSTTFLLKTINAFRRSFELNEDLTSLGMLNEQNGSIIGYMLWERNELLDLADINLNYIRCTDGTNFKLDDTFRMEGGKYVDDRQFDMNALQTEMTAFHILFDVYKVLSVELHRRDTSEFVTHCLTCRNGYLMKTKMQSLIDTIRECLPLNNLSCIDNEDPC